MKFFRERSWLLVGIVAVLFWIAVRGAYKGYFMDDDLDNLSWVRLSPFSTFGIGLLAPKYYIFNFRPVGHLYFWLLERTAGLNYTPYVAVLHGAHIFNLCIVWNLAAAFRLSTGARMIALLVFGFHMAVFDTYYRPMYIFDVLCGTFCFLSILAYRKDQLWLSVLCGWLAFKSKELAIMLPMVLLCYEVWFGSRRWKRLIPFFAISLVFGAPALIYRDTAPTEYSLIFTIQGLVKSISFYATQITFIPYAGLFLLAIPFFTKDRRVWFGVAMCVLFLGPMLFVPGRLYGAYMYLPLAGIGLAMGTLADRSPRIAWFCFALLAILWVPVQYFKLRQLRNVALAVAGDNREYVSALQKLVKVRTEITTAIIDGAPAKMHRWGVEGALRYIFRKPDLKVKYAEELEQSPVDAEQAVVQLSWDPSLRVVYSVARDSKDQESARIEMSRMTPLWQLEKGFFEREAGFRWIAPYARARLWRPVEAKAFDVTVNIGPDYIRLVKRVTLKVKVDGIEIGSQEFIEQGIQTVKWPLSVAAKAATSTIEFDVSPSLQTKGDPRPLGIPIVAFGFRL